jgi:uncharacterized repeat protein (TIGR03803 family)
MLHKPYILGWLVVLIFTSLTFAEWNEKVLYSFQDGTDGATPVGGVVFDKAGNLYGATMYGGSSACPPGWCGTIYELSPPTQKGGNWTEQVLHVFGGYYEGDGAMPSGGLIMDNAGNLYGVTGYGGTGPCILFGTLTGCGAVYELSPPQQQGGAWTETILYSFQGGDDGNFPQGSLVFDGAGNLYGATWFGGGQGTTCDGFYGGNCGTIFEVSPPQNQAGQWTEKVLHSFAGGTDGALPNGGLVIDAKGAIYGTSFYGGNEAGPCDGGIEGIGCGTVFQLLPPALGDETWGEEVLFRFNASDGAEPAAGVVLDKSENLYGTASAGGPHGNGAVFALVNPHGAASTWTERVLHLFRDENDGADPLASVALGPSGDLYGTAYVAQSVSGTVFHITLNPAMQRVDYTVLYGFAQLPNGAQPDANLIEGGTSKIYSTTQKGGTSTTCQFGCGTVFELSP